MTATSMVDTEFTLWSPDDEFCLPASLMQSVRKMVDNSKVGCTGKAASLSKKTDLDFFSSLEIPLLDTWLRIIQRGWLGRCPSTNHLFCGAFSEQTYLLRPPGP